MKKILCLILLLAICISSTACVSLESRTRKDKDKEEDRIGSNDDEDGENEDREKRKNEAEDQDDSSDVSSQDPADQPEGGIVFEKDFGTFSIPEGWEESKNHSTDEKFFYIPEGNDNMSYTDNISIIYGNNKYSEDEVTDFKDAIMRQLLSQIPEDAYEQMTGEGTYTQNGYLLITIRFIGVDDGTDITFFYIVGDYKFCEVYLTCKDDPEEAEAAAQMIVDSFVWKEED